MKRLINALLLLCLVISSDVFAEEQLRLISRSDSGNLEKYNSYVNTAILRFKIPEDISFVSFKFIADEVSKNLFDCYPRNVSLFLTRGAPPVINPDRSKFPTNFMLQSKPEIYEIRFKSDNQPKYINLTTPYPGLYYAATFNPYTNPRDEGITQHGLSPECTSTVDAYLYARFHNAQFIKDHLNTSVNVTSDSRTAVYKLLTPDAVDHILICIRAVEFCPNCADLLVKIGRGNVEMENVTLRVRNDEIQDGNIQLWVREYEWYYITFEIDDMPLTNNKSTIAPINSTLNQFITLHFTITYFSSLLNTTKLTKHQLALKPSALNELNSNLTQNPTEPTNITSPLRASTKLYRSPNDLTLLPYKEYPLIKGSKSDSFLYTFDLHPDDSGKIGAVINLTENEGAVLTFNIQDGLDVGGTLQFILAVKPMYKGGARNGGGRRVRLPTANHTILACISPHGRLIPTFPNLCIDPNPRETVTNSTPTLAAIVLNRTSTDDSVQIPFPEGGRWYVTLHMYCNGTCERCHCSDECTEKYRNCVADCEVEQQDGFERYGAENEISRSFSDCTLLCRDLTLALAACASCDCIAGCLRRRLQDPYDPMDSNKGTLTERCNSSVLFDISSYPCVQSGCGSNGKCVYMLSEGFVYSSCSCRNNYKGWDCMDDSEANSFFQIVLELLLLVFSNIMFLPAAFFAYRRRYFVEMVVYLSTCFFSSFYHYCDAGENIVSVCILPLYALQFCDFYCGLMGIWVTLVAMAHLPAPWPSIAHMLGAVILGCGTTYDKQSIWVFVLPAAAGAALILSTWSVRFFRTRRMFPSRKYLSIFLPAGLVIVALALLMYATLQTKDNYKYVHSAWHILMAIGVILLLPDETTFVSEA